MNEEKLYPKSIVWKTRTEPIINPFISESLELIDKAIIKYESPKIDYKDDLKELVTNLESISSTTLWTPDINTEVTNVDNSSWFSIQHMNHPVKYQPHNQFLYGTQEFKNIVNHWIEKNSKNLDTQKQKTNFSKAKKTLKIRILPVPSNDCCIGIFNFEKLCTNCKSSSLNFKEYMKKQFGFFRWYENFVTLVLEEYEGGLIKGVDIKNNKGKYDFRKVRALIKDFVVTKETDFLGRIHLDYNFRDENMEKQFPTSPLWNKDLEIHQRIPVGAIKRVVANMNSYMANEKHRTKQIKEKEKIMEIKKLKSKKNVVEKTFKEKNQESIEDYIRKNNKRNRKKNDIQNLYFDDTNYPSDIKNVVGYYSFGRIKIPLSKLLPFNKGGANYQYDRKKNRWYLFLPVDVDWKPELVDNAYSKPYSQNENQGNEEKFGLGALDPGCVIMFALYSPENHFIKYGEYAGLELQKLDSKIDYYTALKYQFITLKKNELVKKYSKKITAVQKRKDGLVNELHWKIINHLLANYNVILLPKFEVSKMIRKGSKLTKKTKRMLTNLSFFKFKQRILNKKTTTKVFICDEKYTTKVCSLCCYVNENIGGKREFECEGCGTIHLRDGSGKNIAVKNWHL